MSTWFCYVVRSCQILQIHIKIKSATFSCSKRNHDKILHNIAKKIMLACLFLSNQTYILHALCYFILIIRVLFILFTKFLRFFGLVRSTIILSKPFAKKVWTLTSLILSAKKALLINDVTGVRLYKRGALRKSIDFGEKPIRFKRGCLVHFQQLFAVISGNPGINISFIFNFIS